MEKLICGKNISTFISLNLSMDISVFAYKPFVFVGKVIINLEMKIQAHLCVNNSGMNVYFLISYVFSVLHL